MSSRGGLCVLFALLVALAAALPASAADVRPKKKLKKGYDYDKDKYRSYSPQEPQSYRFDQRGNRIAPSKTKASKGPAAAQTGPAAPGAGQPAAPQMPQMPQMPQAPAGG